MICLIGVDHLIQHNNTNAPSFVRELRTKFRSYLQEEVKRLNIILIAEEFSQEALDESNGGYSNAQRIAEELNIEHRFCDPNSEERKAIGIPSVEEIARTLGVKPYGNGLKRIDEEEGKYFPIRERFWLNKIKDKVNKPIIFISGDNHIGSFKKLLIDEGYEAEIFSKNWGST